MPPKTNPKKDKPRTMATRGSVSIEDQAAAIHGVPGETGDSALGGQ